MSNNSSLFNRVKKLLALSQNNPDIHEAEAALAKAQEMIAKHNISEAFLKAETGDYGSTASITKMMIHASGRVATWLASLAGSVSEVNGCAVYIARGRGIMCVGEESDIALVEILIAYLEKEVIWHCKSACADRKMNKAQGRVFANTFKMGAASTLCRRLLETKVKIEDEVKSLLNGTYALSIIGNKLVRAKGALPKLTNMQVKMRWSPDGYTEGQEAGKHIRLNPERARLQTSAYLGR
jgi:hypothetical protein